MRACLKSWTSRTLLVAIASLAAVHGTRAGTTTDRPAAPPSTTAENKTATSEAHPGAVADVILAQDLFRVGKATSDPLAMLEAARILRGAGVTTSPRSSKIAMTVTGKPDPHLPRDAQDMLAAARDAAGDNAALQQLVSQTAGVETKGRLGGAFQTTTTVDGGHRDVWHASDFVFRGGEVAEVGVSGDGDTPLDLYVYDDNGNLVCASERRGDDQYCSWVPAWTGRFRIDVVNLGDVYNQYYLYTN